MNEIFLKLNEILQEFDSTMSIILAGSAAMLLNDYTEEIKKLELFYEPSVEADAAVDKTKLYYDSFIKSDENLIQFYGRPDSEQIKYYNGFSNLKIYYLDKWGLLKILLHKPSQIDIWNAETIIKKDNIKDLVEIYENTGVDISVIIYLLESAYGEDWLKRYMIDNSANVQKLLK